MKWFHGNIEIGVAVLEVQELPLEWNTLFLEGLILLESILANFNLHFLFLGLLRSLYPQQGQIKPSHLMKILHIWHRFWPSEYLPSPNGFIALSLRHIPLQAITNDIPSCSLANFCQVFYFYWLLFCTHFLLPIFYLDDLIQDFSRCTVSHLSNLYEYFTHALHYWKIGVLLFWLFLRLPVCLYFLFLHHNLLLTTVNISGSWSLYCNLVLDFVLPLLLTYC